MGPAFINTPLIEENSTSVCRAGRRAPDRAPEPAEVAALVAFLASDEASFLTGGYYLADGPTRRRDRYSSMGG